jgi:hypothetical protein
MVAESLISTRQVDPSELGWTHLKGRTWKLPDGRYYEFARGVAMVLMVFTPDWRSLGR